MKDVSGLRKCRNAQTLVFFLLAWGTIMLLCGLAIDSGLLYLAKARMGRAVDGAALAAVGNFNRNNTSPQANRDAVALIMRNFAVANFIDLAPVSGTIGSNGAPSGGVATTTTQSNGVSTTSYFYSFNDGTQDANGAYKRFVDVTLITKGANGAIVGATCNARCPVQTYFIGYATYAIGGRQNVKIAGYSGPSGLADLKVSSSAVATRNPRLIMVVIDRSASMLQQGGGAVGLPPAIVQFLDFFDTSSDQIGIVSFGSSARLEMPLTTNFLIAGTNNLIDAYDTNVDNGNFVNDPGVDPESQTTNVLYEPYYNAGGVRRLKFGGQTAADEGIRLATETLMANPGFSDPDVVKYMVVFTDGAWNACRTLIAAPGYTNEVYAPPANATNVYVPTAPNAVGMITGQSPGPWTNTDLTYALDTNIIPMPSMGVNPARSSYPMITNTIAASQPAGTAYFKNIANLFTNYVWQSVDGSGYEPLAGSTAQVEGAPMAVTNTTWVGTNSVTVGPYAPGAINYYSEDVDVWLQPGAVAFYYPLTGSPVPFVSDYTNPTKHVYVKLLPGTKIDLVVPGYIVDGVLFDGIDLPYSFPTTSPNPVGSPEPAQYFRYRGNNYQEDFMWPDDTSAPLSPAQDGYVAYYSTSLERQLMFRNYPNLLTGFYPYRADEPNAPYNPNAPAGQQGIEPLITDQTTDGITGAPRARYGNGAYYPSAGFYWPFGGGNGTNSTGYWTNAVGVDFDPTYGLPDPNSDPDGLFSGGYTGGSRHIGYSINMLSTDAAPEWYGELFYKGSRGPSAVTGTGNTPVSTIMHSGDFKIGAPPFVTAFDVSGIMVDEATHNTNIAGSPSVWHPVTFNGNGFGVSGGIGGVTPSGSLTGGYVTDGKGNYYADTMAYSGRPTHYYDFSRGTWVAIANNHLSDQQLLPIGNWKVQEYAWHARNLGVTIYTVGYGIYVDQSECQLLANVANATNVVYPSGSTVVTNLDNPFNAGQPIGQQFYATTGAQISNDFYSVGQAINAALTQ